MPDYQDALALYHQYKPLITDRKEAFDRFIHFLENETNWLEAPASSCYHLPIKGGLLIHSTGVCRTLLKMREFMAPQLPVESCIICALFHDIGKVGMPGNPLYIENESKKEYAYKINPESTYSAIAMRSAYLIGRYIPLAEEELQAVLYHDGLYIPEGHSIAHREEALTLLLHWSDYWTAHIEEDKNPIKISPWFTETGDK